MPPKTTKPPRSWSPEQVAFIMGQSAAGNKPAKIGKEVKNRWPEKEISRDSISKLIARQNKKKTGGAPRGERHSSRETSARSEVNESFKPALSSSQVTETLQPPQALVYPAQEFVTPNSSPRIQPFSSFNTPPPAPYQSATSNQDSTFNGESGQQSPEEKGSFASGPRDLPVPVDDLIKFVKRPSAAQLLERLVSLSPGHGGINTDFNRLSRSPPKSITNSPDTILNFESTLAKGVVKNYNPSSGFFNPATLTFGCPLPSLDIPPASSEGDFDFEVKDLANASSSPDAGDRSALFSSLPTIKVPKEPFPAFDHDEANRLLENVTPGPSPTLYDPSIADSWLKRGEEEEANKQGVQDLLVETIETSEATTSVQVDTEAVVSREIEVEAEDEAEAEIVEPIHQVQAEATVTVEFEVEFKSADITQVDPQTQQLNSTPTNALPSTTPDINTTPLLWQPSVHSQTQLSPAINMAVQSILPPTPAPGPVVEKLSFFDQLGSEIIILYVGVKRKEIPIHGNLIRRKSSVLKDFVFATNDAGQAEHYLPESDPDGVCFLIEWLYRPGVELVPGSLATGATLQKDSEEHSAFTKAIDRAIEVYGLAEKFGMGELKDLVMTELGKAYYRHQTFPSSKDIAAAYSRSVAGSQLRKYMARSYQVLADLEDVDVEVAGWTAEEVDEVVAEVPALFKDFRALNRKSKGVESTEPSLDFVCRYHSHGVEVECLSEGLNFRGLTA